MKEPPSRCQGRMRQPVKSQTKQTNQSGLCKVAGAEEIVVSFLREGIDKLLVGDKTGDGNGDSDWGQVFPRKKHRSRCLDGKSSRETTTPCGMLRKGRLKVSVCCLF